MIYEKSIFSLLIDIYIPFILIICGLVCAFLHFGGIYLGYLRFVLFYFKILTPFILVGQSGVGITRHSVNVQIRGKC